MDVTEVKPIQLTPEEAALRKEMEAELSGDGIYSGKAAHRLVESLYERKAIPDVRIRNFTEPSPSGKSHYGSFVRYGRKGKDMYEHPHFVAYLQYFMDGPTLPRTTIEGFRKILIEELGTSGMLMDELCRFVRAETRRLGLGRSAAREEFWRLAREVGYPHADTIWRAAGSAGK